MRKVNYVISVKGMMSLAAMLKSYFLMYYRLIYPYPERMTTQRVLDSIRIMGVIIFT
jgi:hypothetical protein